MSRDWAVAWTSLGRFRVVIWAAITLVIVAYQLGPMLNARWELFDDAETLSWTAPGSRLSIAAAPEALLTKTEVGKFGAFPRYRPVYYSVRVGEAVAFGPDVRAWHLWRMTMFGAVILLCFVAFELWLGPFVGGALTIFVVANWYWQDIWLHLGPAEGIGSVGLALFTLGAALAARDKPRESAWFVAIGTTIAVGSKESFLPLLLPCLLLLAGARKRSPRPREVFALAALPVLMCALVTTSTVLFALHSGADVYLRPVGAAGRISWLWGSWGIALIEVLALPSVLERAGWKLLAPALRSDDARNSWRRGIRVYRAIVWSAAALVAFQLFIYSPITSWPTWAARYDVPGRLASSALIGASLVLTAQFLTLSNRGAWIRWVRAAAVVTLLLIARREFPWALRGAALRQADFSHRLDDRLNGLAAAMRKNPGTPLVVRWNSGAEIEAFGATLQLLRQRGIDGPFYLVPTAAASVSDSLAFAQWGAQMREMSATGATWYGATIRPWRELGNRLAGARTEIEVQLTGYDVPAWRVVRSDR